MTSSPIQFDATIANQMNPMVMGSDTHDCCLVQIYPTNIVDGLVRIEKDSLTIGRDASNDLALRDGSVSRHHARLERSPEGYWLYDLHSTNGSIVDDETVTEHLLVGGESIRIGSFIFKFLRASGIEAQYHSTVYNAMTRDGLTGAFNKSFLWDSLSQEIARSHRCNRPLSVLIMDIDHFKKINDTYGHLAGDEVLREFSHRISASKREDDLFCRYGGEEFVLILGETNLDDAVQVAELCRSKVAMEPVSTTAGIVEVTVSIGATQLSLDGDCDTSKLLELADVQLYRAKQSGRNRVCADLNR